MAKGIKKRLEAACAAAGLDRDLQRRFVELVLTATGPGYVAAMGRSEEATSDRRREEAELARLRKETATLAAAEEEIRRLLGVRSREAIIPAITATLAKLDALKAAADLVKERQPGRSGPRRRTWNPRPGSESSRGPTP